MTALLLLGVVEVEGVQALGPGEFPGPLHPVSPLLQEPDLSLLLPSQHPEPSQSLSLHSSYSLTWVAETPRNVATSG